MTHPDYERPADTRPARGSIEGPLLRAVLFILFAFLAVAIPLVALRCVWQFSPLAAIAAATLAALYITRKVSNR